MKTWDLDTPESDIAIGDYVLATKYTDGDPGDHWVVGFYAGPTSPHYDPPRFDVWDEHGKNFRGNGFRRIKKISKSDGAWMLEHKKEIEASGKSVWAFLESHQQPTATPAVHAVEPLKPTLPEPPFTISQILCNFDLMRHTPNIEWCHNVARDVMERDITGCDQCAQGYCCPLNEVTKDRDYWRQGCVNALLVISDLHVERDELRQSLTGFLAGPMTRENEDAMRQAMIALGLKPHAPKMM